MGTSHRVVAAAAWVGAASAAGAPAWQAAAGVPVAVAFAAGVTSPDVDNTRLWKRLDGWLPDEALGGGGPLGHRRITHWWGWPALAAVALLTVGSPWYGWAAVVGWASHIAADLVVGRGGYGTPQGVPLLPWWGHVGVGIKCGGILESAVAYGAAAAVAAWIIAT